jgi:hypothetical protein
MCFDITFQSNGNNNQIFTIRNIPLKLNIYRSQVYTHKQEKVLFIFVIRMSLCNKMKNKTK